MNARRLFKECSRDEAWAAFKRSKRWFEQSLELMPEDDDAWASLGGLLRRAAEYTDTEQGRRAHEDAALRAYEEASRIGSSAYTVLNAIEYGAVVRYRRALEQTRTAAPGCPSNQERPDAVLFTGEALRVDLGRALFVRERQFRRGEDRPWPAFDLARGRHYLSPNVPRLLNDLGNATKEVRLVARGPSDRWMIESAAQTFRELCAAELPVDGLDDALILLRQAALDDRWAAGDWEPPPGAANYLSAELEAVTASLESMRATVAQTGQGQQQLLEFAGRTRERWTLEDEEHFQEKEKPVFLKAIEPSHKRVLRAIWKMGGETAVGCALEGLIPGATAASIATSVAGKLIERTLESD